MTGVLAEHVQTNVDSAVPQMCAVRNDSVRWLGQFLEVKG